MKAFQHWMIIFYLAMGQKHFENRNQNSSECRVIIALQFYNFTPPTEAAWARTRTYPSLGKKFTQPSPHFHFHNKCVIDSAVLGGRGGGGWERWQPRGRGRRRRGKSGGLGGRRAELHRGQVSGGSAELKCDCGWQFWACSSVVFSPFWNRIVVNIFQ